MSNYTIGVEYQAVNPPKPTGFGVLSEGRCIAILTLEQIEDALARYREMEAARRAVQPESQLPGDRNV